MGASDLLSSGVINVMSAVPKTLNDEWEYLRVSIANVNRVNTEANKCGSQHMCPTVGIRTGVRRVMKHLFAWPGNPRNLVGQTRKSGIKQRTQSLLW